MNELIRHRMDEHRDKKVVVLDFPHGSYAVVVAAHFRDGITKGTLIRKANLESFDQEADLGVGTLMFIDSAERGVKGSGSGARLYLIHICRRDVVKDKRPQTIIVLNPDVVEVRQNARVRTGQSSFQPRTEAILHGNDFKFAVPRKPIRFVEVEDEIGRPR